MKLWKIEQHENGDYDTYDSAVVALETSEEAKHFHPSEFYRWGSDEWEHGYSDGRWEGEGRLTHNWTDPDNVSVSLIGEAADGVNGLICASFNAG